MAVFWAGVEQAQMMQQSHSFALVLGIAQDAGVPQAGCSCPTCRATRAQQLPLHHPACLGLIDRRAGVSFLIDATPAFPSQLDALQTAAPECRLAGIVLTHAHIGHYTGLIHLGREVMDTRALPVFCSAPMASFLSNHAPWRQLVELGNIALHVLTAGEPTQLSPALQLTPQLVPHRAEWSDTLAVTISGPQRRIFYCPDIDRWEDWQHDIRQVVENVDVALLDGTFFSGDELPGRDMRVIPHPTIHDSMQRLSGLSRDVRFIHLNHTNPLLVDAEYRHRLQPAGFGLATEGQIIPL